MKTKMLLGCGVIGGPLFIFVFLVEGATRSGYDPLRHPVSSLALGDSGWMQTANFLVAGLLTLAFAVGLRRAFGPPKSSSWGPLLVGVWAISLLGAGVFVTDPVSGYPLGTFDQLDQHTWHGALHDLFSLPGFVALATSCFVFCRRFTAQGEHGWATYSAGSDVVFVGAFVLASAGFGQTEGLVNLAGLFQRAAVTVGFGWLTLLAIRFLRSSRKDNLRVVPISDGHGGGEGARLRDPALELSAFRSRLYGCFERRAAPEAEGPLALVAR